MMKLTEAQFRILAQAAAEGTNVIERGADATEGTLRSLAARHIGRLEYQHIGARKVVAGLYVTVNGWLIWSEESRRRDTEQRTADNARIRTQPADPFAVHTQSAQARREAMIDAAFAI
jgi:hypothetical protein